MGKEKVVYPYNGMLLSFRKEGKPSCGTTWMSLEDEMLSGISHRRTDRLHDPTCVQNLNQAISGDPRAGWCLSG